MTEKKEGATKECGNCKTMLICRKVTSTWNGKTSEKLQWQNQIDLKPHFKYAGPGKYSCMMPQTEEEKIVSQAEAPAEPKKETVPGSVKVSSPFEEAELITRWASERAYKIVMSEVEDYSKLTDQQKNQLGQKQGNLTKILADVTLKLMELHNIKSNYGADAFDD